MRTIPALLIAAFLSANPHFVRAQSVSMRITADGIEVRIPGKDARTFKTPADLAAALPGVRGDFEVEQTPPPPPPKEPTTLDPTAEKPKGQKIDITPGKIPALEMLRFLADYSGLPVVHDSKDQALATMEISVIAEIRGADDVIVEAHLAASGVLLFRRTLPNGKQIIEASTVSRRGGGGEPKGRPVVVVGSGGARGEGGGGRPTRAEGDRRVETSRRRSTQTSAGVTFSSIPSMVRAQVELEGGEGVFVRDVSEETRGRRGALRVFEKYDIVTRVGAHAVRSPRDLVEELARYHVGEDMTIRLLRKGGTKILRVKR